MRGFIAVARKEMRLIRRDPVLLALQLLYAPLILFAIGAAFGATARGLPVAVRDLDGTSRSRALVRELGASRYLRPAADPDPRGALESGRAAVALEIPAGFGSKLAAGRRAEVQLLIDGSDVATARAAQTYAEAFERHIAGDPGGAIEARASAWFNPSLDDASFFVPGAIALLVAWTPIIITSLTLVREKVEGTWTALRLAPIGTGALLAGKLAPYLVQSLAVAAAVIAAGVLCFDVPVRGSLGALALGTGLFVGVGVVTGAFISAISATEDHAWLWFGRLALLPGIALSGFAWPIESLPPVAQALSRAFPVRTYLDLLRGTLIRGASAADVAPDLAALAAFAAGGAAAAFLALRRRRAAQ